MPTTLPMCWMIAITLTPAVDQPASRSLHPGVKINGTYHRDVLLAQHLLPAIQEIPGDFFIFQQDRAPATVLKRQCSSCQMLHQTSSHLCSNPQTAPTLFRWITTCGPYCRSVCIK